MKSKDYKLIAKKCLKDKWSMTGLVFLIFSLVNGALVSLTSFTYGISIVVTLLITLPAQISLSFIALSLLREDYRPQISDLLYAFKNDYTRNIGLTLLKSLYLFLWSLLLFIPGIIMNYAYSMAFYLAIEDDKLSVSDALKVSKAMMRGHKWELFCLDLSFIGWALLSVLTCGILFIWVVPYIEASKVAFYDNLKKKTEKVVLDTPLENASEYTDSGETDFTV